MMTTYDPKKSVFRRGGEAHDRRAYWRGRLLLSQKTVPHENGNNRQNSINPV